MSTPETLTAAPVQFSREGRCGKICINNPPVNALGQAVRQGLLEALQQALEDKAVDVIVVVAAGRTFIAGADIREFGKSPQPPLLANVITALEDSHKPIVAVLHGTALGGGLEVALGCHWRIALEGTRVGLPEVKLGLLPGAGGTQRLPRLAGIDMALDMMTSGRFVDASEAWHHGIVDEVVAGDDPQAVARMAAKQWMAGQIMPRVTRKLSAPANEEDAMERYRERLGRDVPYLFSPFRCVEAVEAATQLPFTDGIARERELFRQCMDSPQRAGLIHHFFAVRDTYKVPGVKSDAVLTTLGLLGHHPLFEALAAPAAKAGVTLVNLDEATSSSNPVTACLVAADIDSSRYQRLRNSMPTDLIWIEVATTDVMSRSISGISLVLPPHATDLLVCELVDNTGNAIRIQEMANTLRRLKCQVVVTKGQSVIAKLDKALKHSLNENTEAQVVAWSAQGWDLTPWQSSESLERAQAHDADACRMLDHAWQEVALRVSAAGQVHRGSDVDVLAIQAFGYPAHLGGPSFRALSGAES
ncbi:putative enoyl-CoA hydratase [Halomonas elongata]|uniref:Putative enoyl-CoA hydratase n=1 Tax=Halomonas elongata TaxID=2746 RepID=A0A1B8P6Q1_HALEL|nr:enoyl-CoA hydratase/isomerase family protein [Halomonas elongata]OBX37893.1 putative enoyl-CoA hydratase [Halomonas elongata]